VSTDGAPQ